MYLFCLDFFKQYIFQVISCHPNSGRTGCSNFTVLLANIFSVFYRMYCAYVVLKHATL